MQIRKRAPSPRQAGRSLRAAITRGMRGVLGALACCLAAAGIPAAARATPPAPINLLLITIDTLRADHLSAYGYEKPTSRRLDALAREGVLFSDLIAPRGQTWPSIASLFTSMHPREHGVRSNGIQLDPTIPTLAQTLGGAGYATAGFITNMYYAHQTGFDPLRKTFERDTDTNAAREAAAWIRSHRDRPFLLWVHLSGPHDPYQPSKNYAWRFATGYRGPLDGGSKRLNRIHRKRIDLSPEEVAHVRSLYDAEVAQVDARVGELLAELDQQALRGNTLVVVTSDHGDSLYEHDHYWFHHLSIYESVLHVPLILRLPGVLPAGARIGGVARMMDVAPTLLDLLGVPAPASFRGRSLLPRVRGATDGREVAAFSELGPRIHSIRTERWHFIANPDGYTSSAASVGDEGHGDDFDLPPESLYDIVADPREKLNLVDERPDVAEELRGRLARWLAEREDSYEKLVPVGEMVEELKALGYVQ